MQVQVGILKRSVNLCNSIINKHIFILYQSGPLGNENIREIWTRWYPEYRKSNNTRDFWTHLKILEGEGTGVQMSQDRLLLPFPSYY